MAAPHHRPNAIIHPLAGSSPRHLRNQFRAHPDRLAKAAGDALLPPPPPGPIPFRFRTGAGAARWPPTAPHPPLHHPSPGQQHRHLHQLLARIPPSRIPFGNACCPATYFPRIATSDGFSAECPGDAASTCQRLAGGAAGGGNGAGNLNPISSSPPSTSRRSRCPHRVRFFSKHSKPRASRLQQSYSTWSTNSAFSTADDDSSSKPSLHDPLPTLRRLFPARNSSTSSATRSRSTPPASIANPTSSANSRSGTLGSRRHRGVPPHDLRSRHAALPVRPG